MVIFHSYVNVYQRVFPSKNGYISGGLTNGFCIYPNFDGNIGNPNLMEIHLMEIQGIFGQSIFGGIPYFQTGNHLQGGVMDSMADVFQNHSFFF
jgi:hypothetical protein